MKLTIREGVWETNSSSVHAISIPKKKVDMDMISPTTVYFKHGEYGWGHEIYSSVNDKASYLYQALFEVYWTDQWTSGDKKRKNLAKREKAINWIYDTLGKHGITAVFDAKHEESDGWPKGYIDHGNALIDFVEAIIGNEKRLLAYLFGDGAICTSNDNSDMDDYNYFIENNTNKDYEIYEKWN